MCAYSSESMVSPDIGLVMLVIRHIERLTLF